MKNLWFAYLILFICLSLSPSAAIAQDPVSNPVGFIATDTAINVRNRPSANGAVIATLPANLSVTIIETSDDGAWLSVALPDGRTGWVSASLMRVVESAIPADLVEITPENASQLEQITQLVPSISTELVFSPDSRLLVTHFWENHFEVYDVRTKILVTQIAVHTDNVADIVFSPDGSEIASASWDGLVKIWNTQTWGERTTLNGHASGANAVAYSPDGSVLATGGNDGTVIIWKLRTGERIQEIEAHTQPVNLIAFSPDGTKMATTGRFTDGVLRLWDVATGERIWQKGGIAQFTFSPDGTMIAAVGGGSGLALTGVDVETSSQTFAIRTAGGAGTNVDFNPAGTLLAVGQWRTGTFNVIDIEQETVLFTDDSQRRSRQVTIITAFSPDGRLIATASDEAVFLWGVRGSD